MERGGGLLRATGTSPKVLCLTKGLWMYKGKLDTVGGMGHRHPEPFLIPLPCPLNLGWGVTASCSGEGSSQLWVEGETSTPVPTPINSQQIVHSSGAGNKWAGRQK